MSDTTSHAPTEKAPAAAWWVSTKVIVWTLVGFLLFALGSFKLHESFSRLPSEDLKRVAERQEILAKLQAETKPKLESYALLDKTTNRVSLPIQRAMELTVTELAQKPIKATALPAGSAVGTPTPTTTLTGKPN